MSFNHEDSQANHRITRWTFANAAARAAKINFVAGDKDKVAKDNDTGTYWIVVSVASGVATWKSIGTSLSAFSTDDLPEGSTNLYFTSARVRATVLTGLSLATNAAITATNTVLEALGLLQKQITDLGTSKQNTLVSGTNIKTINSTSLLGSSDITLQTPISLTTTGTSGSSTFDGVTLNIPVYAGGAGSESGSSKLLKYINFK